MRPPFNLFAAAIFWLTVVPAVSAAPPVEALSAGLTNAVQIRRLSAAQAARALPVLLRGVVVDESEPREAAVILADPTASLYLRATTNLFAPYHRTDLLEIAGITSQGEYAPCILTTKVRKLGNTAVPPARPVTYQQLITGALDAQFVEMTGVVRRCSPAAAGDTTWRIVLAADGGAIPVRIPLPQNPRIQVDAEVAIQAVCLYEFNKKRQALSPVLQVPHGLSVGIVRPPPDRPFDSPVQSLGSLLQFSPEVPYGHRIHVHGTVTSSQPGSQVWIRDESSSLRIQAAQGDKLAPGDEIDVLGFPGYGSSAPLLEDATYCKTGALTPPAPLLLTNASMAYDHQDDLVSMKGTLIDVQSEVDTLVLTLKDTSTSFKAVLKLPADSHPPPTWQPGSFVRAIGICDVIYDSSKPVMGIWHPESFQILLRSSADLAVVKTPPWWNARHVILLLGIFAGGSLGASGAVLLLARRRLNEQARRRAMAEAEFAAILAERNRLAREIHDTLAQGYTATLLQLELVKFHAISDPAAMNQHLGKAQNMIRESLKEARHSIWQMQPQVLESTDLAGALRHILNQLSDSIIPEARFEVTGRERRFSPAIESNILRLGQEAITNAVKHSRAQHLSVRLDFNETEFVLWVVDDGGGFDPAHPPPSEGGFGLVGMQGRAKELNGQLKIRTALGQGTEVQLCVSLAAAVDSPRTR